MSKSSRKDLVSYLGEELIQHELMQMALTHSSAGRAYNNERLEFFGDAVLGFMIAKILYQEFENEEEGRLSRWRSYLVRGETLSILARELQLSKWLIIGASEEKNQGRNKESILENTLEAIIGALYLLWGEQRTQMFIKDIFSDRFERLPALGDLKDAKTLLQEILQKDNHALPVYEEVGRQGRDFRIRCKIVISGIETIGQGTTKSRAEQDAARQALDLLEKHQV